MQTILNLSGVRVHVGFWRQSSRNWRIDVANCYVIGSGGQVISEVDDIDALGIMRNGVFHSVCTLAEEWIDGQSAAIELVDRRSVVEGRE